MRAQVSTHSPPPTAAQTTKGGREADRVLRYTAWCKEVKTDTDGCAHMDRTGFQM